LVFDEIYYVDGARDFLKYGVEMDGTKAEFIVHPPLGKWLIALGMQIFGDHSFGWRIATAVFGTAMIILIALVAHELFHSRFLTVLASALMAVDGLALVHSRTSLLDNFLAFFILLASYLFIRGRLWLMALALGLALSIKWSALYFIAIFAAISLYRTFRFLGGKELIKPTLKNFAQFGFIPVTIYVASWFGWFKSNLGWDRTWSDNPISSFIYYHQQMLQFHTGLTDKHSYQSNPWSWLVMGRPTSFYYETPTGCGSESCSQEVLALGTPFLWWFGAIAILVVFGVWISKLASRSFDPAVTLIVSGMAAGYLPWFFFQQRTTFSFYAIIFEPFVILALIYCAWLWMEKAKNLANARFLIIAIYVVILLNFLYFLPLFRAEIITYEAWNARMWLPSWI
jgi:dolichyl-phosphate-mannose--protein O-mannosyl transferase